MNSLKGSRFFALAVVPALVAGLFLALQTDPDKGGQGSPFLPGILAPEGEGSGSLSIVPDDQEKTKIEYRNILFTGSSENETFRI